MPVKECVLRIDGDFYYGDGKWGPSFASAKRYRSPMEAIWDLSDADINRGWLTVCGDCGENPCKGLIK
jgi:hypothetical protein